MQTCIDCKYFVKPSPASTYSEGECRRFPPSVEGFAKVEPTMYCGEYLVRSLPKGAIPELT